MRGGGLADLLREETAISGAAGVAIPQDFIRLARVAIQFSLLDNQMFKFAVQSEPIRRVRC